MNTTLATTLPPETIRITTDSWTEPYWNAAKDDRLEVPQCSRCGTFRMPPSPFCPECQSQDVKWVQLSGQATIFSYSIVRGLPGLPDIVLMPVVLELDGAPGIHFVGNAVDVDPGDVAIGMVLHAAFVEIADGWKLPVFRRPG